MDLRIISDYSDRLRKIARDLSFLGHPHYPLKQLHQLFPQHRAFINELEDVNVSFKVDLSEKRRRIDSFLVDLSHSELPAFMKKIFTQRCEDYQQLIAMMETFGTIFFYDHCTRLYGSSKVLGQNDAFHYFLEELSTFCVPDQGRKDFQGEVALDYLRVQLKETFSENDFEVKASSSLLSDSSAGRRTLKLNPHKTYSKGQLDIFLVHEGWVHLGTSINGAKQTEHPWLSTWAPRTTFLQEGLAILVELLTGSMTPERWNKVLLRHLATSMAERGSKIEDVYAYLRHHAMDELDAFKLALRIFRGVPLEGGMAFTKELLYLHGLIKLLHHLHFFKADLRSLWVGKVSFEEHIILLENKDTLRAPVTCFPARLLDQTVQERLQRLTELSFCVFNRGFV